MAKKQPLMRPEAISGACAYGARLSRIAKRANQENIVSETVAGEYYSERLEEAKNIALGWRIVGQVPPQNLAEAMLMLRDSSAFAAKVCDLLTEELSVRQKR